MENQVQLFESEEFGRLEVLMFGDKPYSPATECARILGYNQPEHAIKRHCKGCMFHTPLTAGEIQKVKFIPEGDLYRLIIRSKLPSAARFERWVFDSVLPSIRQHGAYITEAILERMLESEEFTDELLETLADERVKRGHLESRVAELSPKARYCDTILRCQNAIQVSIIAKDYGMSAVAFNRLLHGLKIQYRVGDTRVLYQRFADKGYTKSRTYYTASGDGIVHTYWTQEGRFFLYETLKSLGILPLIESCQG